MCERDTVAAKQHWNTHSNGSRPRELFIQFAHERAADDQEFRRNRQGPGTGHQDNVVAVVVTMKFPRRFEEFKELRNHFALRISADNGDHRIKSGKEEIAYGLN